MGPTWVLSAPDGPHDGPMNLAIKVVYPLQKWSAVQNSVVFFFVSLNSSLNKLSALMWCHFNINVSFQWVDNSVLIHHISHFHNMIQHNTVLYIARLRQIVFRVRTHKRGVWCGYIWDKYRSVPRGNFIKHIRCKGVVQSMTRGFTNSYG